MGKAVRVIWCCGCGGPVEARLTDGKEVYRHRPDLYALPFWRCDKCGNFVGCHHKTADRTKPLGCIPTPELKRARGHIHAVLDPLWKKKRLPRKKVYEAMSRALGKEYHTAEIASVEEARDAYRAAAKLAKAIDEGAHL